MIEGFDKFTTYYKRTLIAAFHKAAENGSLTVEVKHLLYGITLQKGSVGFELLSKSGLSSVTFAKLLNAETRPKPIGEPRPVLSEHAQAIIVKSVLIATEFGHRYIGTEHLLCSMIHALPKSMAELFKKLGANFEKVSVQIKSVLKGVTKFSELTGTFDSGATNDEIFEKSHARFDKNVGKENFATELTSEAMQKNIDPVIGREKEVERMIHILSRRQKNNPLLLGDPGVGKTAIVEGLAKKIFEGDVPETLMNKKIWKVDMASLIAGTIYRGEFEGRLKQLLDEVKNDSQTILFIDEIHNVIGTGSASGSLDTANILKPALARGEIKLIGATTFHEYKKHIETDPAFERRLQTIHVNEPSKIQTREILLGVQKYYEDFHHVSIHNSAIDSAIELSEKYIKDRFFPDKAIDLIDEASAKYKVSQQSKSEAKRIKELEHSISVVKKEKHEAVLKEDFEQAYRCKKFETIFEKKLIVLRKKLAEKQSKIIGEITASDIAKTISSITGIPLEDVSQDEKKHLLTLEKKLNTRIIGQTHATKKVSEAILRSRSGIRDHRRPLASFLFAGPSGVGKTETAKTLAQLLFGNENSLIRIDMSEYSEKFNISKLIGSPAGYVGYKESNTLADRVKRNPYSIILFDEIEKAHKDVYSLLLQILEDGHLTDAAGTKIHFKNAIIILTSNSGQHLYGTTQKEIGFGTSDKNSSETEKLLKKELQKTFQPELLNRLDEIVFFNALSIENLSLIAKLHIEELNKRMKAKNMSISAQPEVYTLLAEKNYEHKYGARSIRRNISELLENQIAHSILSDIFKDGDHILITAKNKNLNLKKKQATIVKEHK